MNTDRQLESLSESKRISISQVVESPNHHDGSNADSARKSKDQAPHEVGGVSQNTEENEEAPQIPVMDNATTLLTALEQRRC